jgi:hypothetical protein
MPEHRHKLTIKLQPNHHAPLLLGGRNCDGRGTAMARDCTCRLRVSRRRLLVGGAAFGGTVLGGRVTSGLAAPGVVTSDRTRPQTPYGVMSGDPTGGRAIIWSKTDRPARMLV